MIAVNGHLGYYFKRNLVERIEKDVLDPALARGCKEIWFLGTSVGGLGAILYSNDYPEEVDGILLIAPFMGNSGSIELILKAGDVEKWDPDKARIKKWQKKLWNCIKDVTSKTYPKHVIYLAYGTNDECGHNWRSWLPLWSNFLDVAPFPREITESPRLQRWGILKNNENASINVCQH